MESHFKLLSSIPKVNEWMDGHCKTLHLVAIKIVVTIVLKKKNCCYNCSALLIEQDLKLKNVALNPTQSHVCNKCPPKWKLYQILFKVINLMTAQAVPNTERVHHYISITKTKTNAPLPGLTNFVFHQPPTHKRKRL